jgi:hypothetical protein
MGLIEREWLPVGAFMAAMAVCEIPNDTALEVLRIARVSTDEPPPNRRVYERTMPGPRDALRDRALAIIADYRSTLGGQ